MYAVVETSGRQLELIAGKFVDIDLTTAEPGQEHIFDRVLMIVNGDSSLVGSPYIDGAKVTGKVIGHVRDKKITVFKYRPKKGTRKRTGHRQSHTRVFINGISLKEKTLSEGKDTYTKQTKI